MADPRLIGPHAASTTPPPFRRPAGRGRELPADLLRDATRRLGTVALMGASLWVLAPALLILALRAADAPLGGPHLQLLLVISACSIVVSLGVFAYTRRPTTKPEDALDLGLAYLIVTAFAIGLSWHSGPRSASGDLYPMITWVGPVILMFAALTPAAPLKTAAASLIAASMMPVAMLVARARGEWHFESASAVLIMHYPDYLIAGIGVVIANVFTRLGHQVAKAREMGSYQLGDLLGAGGMGQVYHATHRMLARPAAIKLIRPEALTGGDLGGMALALTRFRREAKTAASLRSPHTVELYDFGVTEDQTMYFVMELLEGMNLDMLVRAHGPMPAGRVVHILCQVCESLEEAHTRGLVHRDIKPDNIHLCRLGLRYDFAKVLDFGLVKSVADGGAPGEHTGATASGLTPGTPAYMSPEAALGDTLDGRSDIYALGCVAYWLLTGQPVFEASTSVQVIAKHLRNDPVPPSVRAPYEVPPELDRLVLACLAKRPDDRPVSAAELSRALAAIPVEPWTGEMARTWWEQHHPIVRPGEGESA